MTILAYFLLYFLVLETKHALASKIRPSTCDLKKSGASKFHTTTIDLSYKPELIDFPSHIRAFFDKERSSCKSEDDNGDKSVDHVLNIELTSSLHDKAGFPKGNADIMLEMFRTIFEESEKIHSLYYRSRRMRIKSSMNQLSANDADEIFQFLTSSFGKVGKNIDHLLVMTDEPASNSSSSLSPQVEGNTYSASFNLTGSAHNETEFFLKENDIENIDIDKDTATIAILDVVPTLTSSPESNISFHGQTAIIDYLDLSMNNLGQEKIYAKSLRKLVSGFDDEGYKCGTKMLDSWTLKLDMCDLGPIACRAIGKGMIKFHSYLRSASNPKQSETSDESYNGISNLSLCNNPAISDSGCAAIAAALLQCCRSSAASIGHKGNIHQIDGTVPSIFSRRTILNSLALSACNIGDIGAEAIATSIAQSSSHIGKISSHFSGILQKLDISNNAITNEGACAIAQSLLSSESPGCQISHLDISNNRGVTNHGASDLALSLQNKNGYLRSLDIRSCGIKADGAYVFGTAIKRFAICKPTGISGFTSNDSPAILRIDLSGNHLGNRPLKVKNKGAKAFANKASNQMNAWGAKLKDGFKGSFGVDLGAIIHTSAESDDDMEDADEGRDDDDISNKSKNDEFSKCGILALVEAIIDSSTSDDNTYENGANKTAAYLGVRQCNLDLRAFDALAAAIIHAKEKLNMILIVDATMNSQEAANEQMTLRMCNALLGNESESKLLEQMSKRHLDANSGYIEEDDAYHDYYEYTSDTDT